MMPRAENDSSRAESFLRLIERSKRGKLKVYLGYGPGVGKTYRMLLEARALDEQGVDVVIGYVEDHGREETQALLEGLEVVPRRREEYHGMTLEEMDVDAVLERNPAVVLVDELAHTNAPRSRNKKRYEDVLELLEAGVHVLTTLNVQHLESLYNTVEQLTGVKVRERLPDWVLGEADQVVNIDLSTEDLQERMEAGKIYPQERVRKALANFFTQQNLEHLRNLTLREVAAHIEERGRTNGGNGPVSAPDQVMVCLSSRGPDSATLLRYASRLAGRLNRTWYALYVQKPAESPERIDAKTQRLLGNTLALANQLGATVFTFKGEDVVETIGQFAREYGVGHIVIGRSKPLSFWRRLFGEKTTVDRLLEKATDTAVVVVDTLAGTAATEPRRRKEAAGKPPPKLSDYLDESRIVVWDAPVGEEEAVETLLRHAARAVPELNFQKARQALWGHEERGWTFPEEGVALPHVRLREVKEPVIALGLLRGGLTDIYTRRAIEFAWLVLLPEEGPVAFTPTTLISRMYKDPQTRRMLERSTGAEQALQIIQRWERTHL